jgi:hypothetical protein
MLDDAGTGGTLEGSYPHVACTFSEAVGEFVYCDLTEASDMVFFGSEVDSGINTLESLANEYSKQPLFGHTNRNENEVAKTKCMTAKLMDSTLFESEDGDVTTLTEGATAAIVGGYHNYDAGECFLHLEFTDTEGKRYRAASAYSRVIPILAN